MQLKSGEGRPGSANLARLLVPFILRLVLLSVFAGLMTTTSSYLEFFFILLLVKSLVHVLGGVVGGLWW
jgi:type III secretory pathway component EscT